MLSPRIMCGASRSTCLRARRTRQPTSRSWGTRRARNVRRRGRVRSRDCGPLVHGHWPVVEVGTSHNRWNIDTGAGTPSGRLSVIEVNALELRTWTFDIAE